MHSPVEKKFEEYLGNIHTILRDDTSYLADPSFINHLLDRLESTRRKFILMSNEQEDVFAYQEHLAILTRYTGETMEWVQHYNGDLKLSTTLNRLKENLFLLNDMFATSQNLIKSFYPAI